MKEMKMPLEQTGLDEEPKESPEYVRLSLAAAMTLRLASGRFYRDAKLYCVNLLLTYSDGCVGRCVYCGLSKQSPEEYNEKSFIRVAWPVHKLTTVTDRLNKYAPWVERVCLSMITNKRAVEDTLIITKYLKKKIEVPISLLISPTVLDKLYLGKLKEAGVDMIGIAIDAATEVLFIKHRSPYRWERYWKVLEETAIDFGRDKFGVHLIVGIGETEKEMVETIQKIRNLGGKTHLFSFYPEKGSKLCDKPPCPIDQYRRIQLARYLIDHGLSSIKQMGFDQADRLTDFSLDSNQLDEIINSGKPFETSGCPGKTFGEGACNRPFGDGPPSDIRSFPFPLNKQDIKKVRRQLTSYLTQIDTDFH